MPSCSNGWQEFEGKCYLWVRGKERNWSAAEDFCKSEGGHLASVTNRAIHEYILKDFGKIMGGGLKHPSPHANALPASDACYAGIWLLSSQIVSNS